MTYAGEKAQPIGVTFTKEGTLREVAVFFEPKSFEAIRDALTAKYGEPLAIRQEAVQTLFGVKLMNERVYWDDARGTIYMKRYTGKITEGALTISLNRFDPAQLEAREKEAAQRQSNM